MTEKVHKAFECDIRCETCRFFMKLAHVVMHPFLGACALKGERIEGRDIFVAVESDAVCKDWGRM